MSYRHIGTISGVFAGPPRGLWVAGRETLYVGAGNEVVVFESGKLARRWKTAKAVCAVAVGGDGLVWTGEAGQVEVFDGGGKPVRQWCGGWFGEITAIGFWKGSVLVGDAQDRCIKRYDGAGKLLNTIGKDNRTQGLLIPNGVVDFEIDGQGIIHVANPGKHRVERYTCEGELLGHIGRFDGVKPEGFGGCCNPTNVALGPQGKVYTTEKAGPRAKVLAAAGELDAVIATTEFDASAKNMAIAVGGRGRVFVADPARRQVLVFDGAAEVAG